MTSDDLKAAREKAKSAVKAYTNDPSDENSRKVQAAWEAVSDLQAMPIWRQKSEAWLRSGSSPDKDGTP